MTEYGIAMTALMKWDVVSAIYVQHTYIYIYIYIDIDIAAAVT